MATKLYNIISALQAVDTSLWSKLSGVQNALYGYSTSGAVNTKFTSIDADIANLKAGGGNIALTGLIEGTGIKITDGSHNATIAVANYDTLTGVISGFTADGSIKTAIDAAETAAKSYTDTASGALKTAYEAADSALSTALINGATTYKTFKAVEDQITAIDTYISGSTGLQAKITANDADISYISGEVKSNDGDITALQNRLSGTGTAVDTFVQGKIDGLSSALVGTGNDYKTFGAVETALDAIDTKLAGVTTVTDFVDDKIKELSLGSALTGVTNPAVGIELGKNGAHDLTGKVLIDNATLSTASNGNLFANLTLSAVQANGYTTKLSLVDGTGTKHGEYDITVKSILSTATYGVATENDGSGLGKGTDYLKLVFKNENNEAADPIYVSLDKLINSDELNSFVSTEITGLSGKVFDTTSGLIKTVNDNTAAITANNGYISTLSGALSGLLSSAAVYNAIEAAKSAASSSASSAESNAKSYTDALEGKLSGAFVKDHIVLGAESGIASSPFIVGDATFAATPLSTTVATEAAVKAFVEDGLDDLQTKIDALNTLITGA